ncbi:MAG TPA: ion channel, partial [Alphaproteobacteria bacterium]|nr:ion channel [Alphaproteobacteria bacterium]
MPPVTEKPTPPPKKVRPRLVPRSGQGLRVIRVGQKYNRFSDLYVELLAMPWGDLIFLIALCYFISNLSFALVFYYNSSGIENAHKGSFQDAFFFSVQTMATIGYGRLVPTTFFVNMMVAIEALWGFCYFAVTTALVFAKFSQPTARVTFSDVAVIGIENEKSYLMLRLANDRRNRIVNAKVELVMLRNEITKEGRRNRRFYDLKLMRSSVPLMQLTWTVMHLIDETSPLYGITPEKLEEWEAEIIVSLTGMDETLSQTIHTRHSYVSDEIICNAMFEDVLNRRDDGYV